MAGVSPTQSHFNNSQSFTERINQRGCKWASNSGRSAPTTLSCLRNEFGMRGRILNHGNDDPNKMQVLTFIVPSNDDSSLFLWAGYHSQMRCMSILSRPHCVSGCQTRLRHDFQIIPRAFLRRLRIIRGWRWRSVVTVALLTYSICDWQLALTLSSCDKSDGDGNHLVLHAKIQNRLGSQTHTRHDFWLE